MNAPSGFTPRNEHSNEARLEGYVFGKTRAFPVGRMAPMTKPHYGLAYPPKPPRWRRRLVLVGLLLAALYWEYGRYTFEIVELDDGIPFGSEPVPVLRYVDGNQVGVKAQFTPQVPGARAVTILDAYRTTSPRIVYQPFGVPDAQRGAPERSFEFRGEFRALNRRCVVVVDWRLGKPTLRGCVEFRNIWAYD